MSISEIKKSLHLAIDKTEDEEFLRELYFLIETSASSQPESWQEMSPALQNAINEGLAQAANGELISDEDFRKRFAKWFSK